MYAAGEDAARKAFLDLKEAMATDATRAVACLEKDLDSLSVHYRFDPSLWRALKTTHAIERVHREFKRRTKSMDALGERTLQILIAFTAIRLEFNWQTVPMDSKTLNNLLPVKTNQLEATLERLMH
jgi:transposase-like protein